METLTDKIRGDSNFLKMKFGIRLELFFSSMSFFRISVDRELIHNLNLPSIIHYNSVAS